MDDDTFTRDLKIQDAVVRNLEIIGEAAGRLPETGEVQIKGYSMAQDRRDAKLSGP